MAIFKIARMGHPILSAPAKAIGDPTAPNWKHLITNMTETLEDASGIGLAAPQIHRPFRLIILHIPTERMDIKDDEVEDVHEDETASATVPLTVMFNPEIEPLSEEMDLGWESCLSLPGLAGEVPRYTHIQVKYQDLDGTALTFEARNFHARVIQHECDHLDGILYVQRMTDMSSFGFTEDINKARIARERLEMAADD